MSTCGWSTSSPPPQTSTPNLFVLYAPCLSSQPNHPPPAPPSLSPQQLTRHSPEGSTARPP